MHPADLIRALLRAATADGPVYFDDDIEQMQALIRGFNRYGGRLNRIVRAVNRGQAPDQAELLSLLNTLGLLIHSVEEFYRAEVRLFLLTKSAETDSVTPGCNGYRSTYGLHLLRLKTADISGQMGAFDSLYVIEIDC